MSNRPGALNLGEMYVWYVDSSDNDQGIWQSLDGGSSWKAINDSGITNCGDTTGCGTVRGSYNLTLAAVANGMATDLYAGAVNLYKCSINILFPACANTGTNTFMNLTHVYGCSDIAKVHPAQHAIDSRVLNGTLLLYFASDGGIYRALDGYTGVTHGTCGLSNQFDSLNETLGPMTQFVSLAQSSSDPNLIFGGTQNNGTPATAFSQSGGAWINVNAGDSGSSAVNPANDSEWFVATPPDSHSGVNLFRCANGINCHTQDFQSDQIAGSNLVGGDTGPPELPFILDPQNAGTVLLGSCRIWRGTTSGGAFQVLGPNFETAGTGICIGTETNQVRAIAAGGAAGSGGNSQVIYAATNGAGPILQGTPPGGRIWVTTGADGGVLSWADRTGSINPSQFPISAIALDSADPTGNTAYVAIMGFHASHVWKTSDAGVSWTDFNANLPDAPANSIVVDSGTSPSSGTVYVGTDIGVFVSPATNANWTEVGPGAPPGILPNVAVTALKIFSGGGLKRLRAATYGRGIWEFNLNTAPDFQLSITNNPLTVFAGQPSSFDGFVYALNGYRASVDLSCTAGATSPPQSCPVLPSSVFPTPAGTSLAVDPIGTAGDYAFNLHGAGSDAAGVTHDFPLVLHVVDFSLSAPSPAAVNVVPGDTSAPVALTLSGLGSFSGSVVLSCAGLPAGASCQFQPSAIVNPTSGNSVAVNLLVSTSANTPVGTSSVAISALTIGEPAKMQTLAMNVNAAADYLMTIANPSLTGSVNIPATFNGVLTAANGYNNLVNLSCGAGSPANCVAAPGGLAPNSGGVPFAVTVNSAISQAYSFNVIGVGTDGKSISHSFRVDFTALPAQGFDFTMGITPGNGTIQAGKTGLYSLDVAPTSGTFPNNVTVSCSGLPALSSCSFNPTQVAVGSGDSVVTISISSTAAVPSARLLISLMIVGFPLLGVVLATADNSKRRRCLVVSATLFLILLPSCGSGLQGNTHGSGSPGTPPGNYNVVVTAVCGNVTHRAPINLVITQ